MLLRNKFMCFSLVVLPLFGMLSCAVKDSPRQDNIQTMEAGEGATIHLADPTIFFHDNQYYMYGTERPPQTGFPVLVSDNLTDWRVPAEAENGYALKMDKGTFGSWGFWAAQVFPHNNKFYMTYTADENIAFAHSDSPLGPFVQDEIRPLEEGLRQIDSFLFQDDDGKFYLYHVRLNKGNHIYVAEINDDFSSIKEDTLTHAISVQSDTWEDTQTFKSAVVAEGPTVIKHKDTYYLFYSANHFQSEDYAVGYATSKSPLGPWKRYEKNPIINNHIIGQKGTGHGDIFFDKDNQPYYVFHAHASDTEVHPRVTLIVRAQFKDIGQEEDIVEVIPESTFFPRMAQ